MEPPCQYGDYTLGGLHWLGCKKWLGSSTDGELVWTGDAWEYLEDVGSKCLNGEDEAYDVFSDHIEWLGSTISEFEYSDLEPGFEVNLALELGGNKPTPDLWRFYKVPDSEISDDCTSDQYCNRELVLSQLYPVGPNWGLYGDTSS